MKKIDLHIHTQTCKTGDGKKREISPENFINKMRENNVEICAITNHNKFDIEEYKTIRRLDEELTIFPGMEIDVNLYNDQHRHIIVIASPEKAQEFDDIFDEKHRNYEDYIISYDEFIKQVKLFSPSEIIIIPHFYLKDKERGLTIEEADKLRNDLKDYVIVLEPKSIQAMGIINAHNDLALFGSDVKDWNSYNEIILPEIKYKVTSFAKFYKLAADPSLFIKTILDSTDSHLVSVSDQPEKYPNLSEPIEIFEDINIVFGEKGSGKTIFVKNYVYPTLKNSGKNVFFHEGKDYKREYLEIIDSLSSKVKIESDRITNIKETLQEILNYSESNNYNGLNKIVNYRNSQLKNKNAMRVGKKDAKVFDPSNLSSVNNLLIKVKRDFQKINDVININKDTLRNQQSINKLDDELNLLKRDILENLTEKIQESFSLKCIVKSVESIQQSIKKQTGSDSSPANIGFADLIIKRLNRAKNNKLLLKLLDDIKDEQINKLGILPNKGEISLVTEIKVLSETDMYNSKSNFDRNGIKSRRELMKKIKHFDISSSFKKINQYFNPEEKEINLDDFLDHIIRRINTTVLNGVNGEHKIYEPSEGEQAILSISAILENNQYDFYIFDEMERGLGNHYISSYLIPKIKELRDRGRTIIISTHNANIAINTLPSQTVFCDYDVSKDKPRLFVGNMYDNRLTNPDSSELIWEKVALRHLEGSGEMFENRRDIYGI
ncbi:PHP domain-containing protein [Streptococcus suis]|uniref:PHP domain-containing protein n=1 Tax=Streptococcus suis TaxID=1307 RepID=UPI000CF3DB8C|nr:PHP domain-containing protein [Streptococcus suis]HEM6072610.1 PHP domain-containing protein [Streptococcus suis]HEM6184670.1 PHP domain-containing protein [Streptococcus suis]